MTVPGPRRGGAAPEEVAKLELHLAELWRAYLAGLLLLWYCGRSKSLRTLTVNWDIYRVADENGKDQILVDPTQDKTTYLRPTVDQERDVPKVLHPKVQSVYETYLRQHYPMLRSGASVNRFQPVNCFLIASNR